MGFFKSLFGRSEDDLLEDQENEEEELPHLHIGMSLDVETPEGDRILTGRLVEYSASNGTLVLDRLPGGLSLGTRKMGASVVVKGVGEDMTIFYLKGIVQESTRVVCKLKDLKVRAISEHRDNFRLQVGIPVTMYYEGDTARSNPENCTLVDISTGGACIESEYLHAEDEVLCLKVKLDDYVPMEFLGEIIRVAEYQPGKFRYGFLFAQLKEGELAELTRMLYNIQAGNRQTWSRSQAGHW